MPNAWFRLYNEFSDDPKVQMMSESDQRRLVMLFCERSKEVKHDETLRAFQWRISPQELAATKAVFMEKGFIDADWNLLNWNRRQFISDSSTDRVRRYRESKKQHETHETKCNDEAPFHEGGKTPVHDRAGTARNVTVTAPDTDSDTDTETDTEQKTLALTSPEVHAGSSAAVVFELPLPGSQGEWGVPQRLYDELTSAYPGVSVMAELGKMRAWLVSNPQSRKTARGLPRFVNSWLAKEQDKGARHVSSRQRNTDTTGAFSRHVHEGGSGPSDAATVPVRAGGNPGLPGSPREGASAGTSSAGDRRSLRVSPGPAHSGGGNPGVFSRIDRGVVPLARPARRPVWPK